MNGEWRPNSPDGKVWMLVDSGDHFVGEVSPGSMPGVWWGETSHMIGLHDTLSSAARWVESKLEAGGYIR